jgi:hypothetical protein
MNSIKEIIFWMVALDKGASLLILIIIGVAAYLQKRKERRSKD